MEWWREWGETGKVVFLHFKQIENNSFYFNKTTPVIYCPNGNPARVAGGGHAILIYNFNENYLGLFFNTRILT